MNGITVGLLIVIVGYLLWGAMFLVRQLEIRAGTMRPRVPWKLFKREDREKGVPGPWDYWTNGSGDVFALPFLDFAVGAIAYQEGVSGYLALAVSLLGVAGVYGFWRMALKYQRARKDIDWWFQFHGSAIGWWRRKILGGSKVRVTVAGYIHFAYYAFQIGVVALWIWFVFFQREGWATLVIIGLIGGAAYIATHILDIIQGHFD